MIDHPLTTAGIARFSKTGKAYLKSKAKSNHFSKILIF